MTQAHSLPRVTYTSTEDFSPLQDYLDGRLPQFRQDMLGRHWPSIVAGEARDQGDVVLCHSPVDETVLLGSYAAADGATVADAIQAARKGFAVWGRMDWRERLKHMRRLADVLDRHRHDLAMAIVLEVGKSRMEALGEAEEALALIHYYADEFERNNGYVSPAWRSADGSEQAQTQLRPMGVFAVVTPFNYPVALAANMLGAALVAGNSVIFKPTPNAALTAGMLARVFEQAELPQGVFNLVYGQEAGPLLMDSDGIDGVAFTGSNATGMGMLRKFASERYMRPVLAEMGGKNYAYVTASADFDIAVNGVTRSAFGFQGQRCTACSVAMVHESLYDRFVDALARQAAKILPGDTADRAVTHGPLINRAALDRYLAAAEHGRRAGRVVCGGERLQGGLFDKGAFVKPTLIADLAADDRLYRDELFAPVLVVSRFKTLEEAIARGNQVDYGLTAGLYSKDEAEIQQFLDHVQTGVMYVNRLTGATNGAWPGIQSFSGWKGSGITGKGALGPHYLPQFMREQSRTIRVIR
ncbi:MAG: aldehyde dehydrogenase family protein [Candidimonas sp.]